MKIKLISLLLCAGMVLGSSQAAFAFEDPSAGAPKGVQDPENVELDLERALSNGVYAWEEIDEDNDGVTDYHFLRNVAYEKNITSPQYQYMNIAVPVGYLAVQDGAITGIDLEAQVNGYTASTAPMPQRAPREDRLPSHALHEIIP